jgi:tetratricopeptide (TPR) repeat protein
MLHGGSHMSHTLNLVDGLLKAARNLQELGRRQAAVNLLERLAGFRNLPPAVAEEAHSRLADLYAHEEHFKQARRHLTIAITYRPQHAAYHHRMACWIEADPNAAIDRAGRYYRCAVRAEPDNAEYWLDYGAYLLATGRTPPGRRALRRAFELASDNAEHVGSIAAVLRDAELWDEARQMLRRAVFQSGRDRRFRALWQQHQFEQLCERQRIDADQVAPRPVNRTAILPFLRTDAPAGPMQIDGRIIRFDAAAGNLTEPKHGNQAPRRRGTR